MKKLFYYLLPAILIFAIQSCTEDPIDDIEPTLEFEAGANYISANAIVDGGSRIKTKLKGLKGSSDLKTFSVFQKKSTETSNSLIDLSVLEINGQIASANPKLILDAAEKSSFSYEVSFPIPANQDTVVYTFELVDENGEKANKTFTIYTKDVRVTTLTAKRLYNAAGPLGRGGIDLHTGISTGSIPSDPTTASAEIIDLGTATWKMQFSPRDASETTIKFVTESFDDLSSKSLIEDAFTGGNFIGTIISPKKNDVYVIKSGIFYFAIKITDIVATSNDNNDYFEMEIKQ